MSVISCSSVSVAASGLAGAREGARALLLSQPVAALPVRPEKLRLPRWVSIDTMERFCRLTNASIEALAAGSGALRDGCTLIRVKNGVRRAVILLGPSERPGRRRFTLAHELGHVLLEHDGDGDAREREANAFAAELLMPRALVRRFLVPPHGIFSDPVAEVAGFFAVSREAARVAVETALRSGGDVSASEARLLARYGVLLPE